MRRASTVVVCLFAGLTAAMVLTGGGGRPARACGGLFCNQPPPNPFDPLPVAQTGENVVFAMDGDPNGGASMVTAHIQILYAGEAALFSWVVPVDAVPTLETGTDTLFTAMANATQPVFQLSQVTDGTCRTLPGSPGARDGGSGTGGSTAAGSGGASGTGGSSGVIVSFQGAVGPYEAAVIQSEDPEALKRWLRDNSYFLGDDAAAIIDDYVFERKHFVALRLQNGKDVRSIQPIVLKFAGVEPCVPLRLTAIAAQNDMQVRLWVLGESRAVPQNFFELEVDQLRIDWLRGGSNYNSLLMEAANEAGGNAFAAEYAGPASVVGAAQLWSAQRFDLTTLRAAQTPPVYVQALVNLGLANDPQMLPLLSQFIPMPEAVKSMGITDRQFYANLDLYYRQYQFPPFDLPGLTMAIETGIITPRRKAQEMINSHSYLTRLNTFISPIEMSKDPLFMFSADLGNVPRVRTATLRTMCGDRQFLQCNAPMRLEVPGGRMVWVRHGVTGDTCSATNPIDVGPLTKLPAAEIVWQREEVGQGQAVIDNSAVIMAALSAHNRSYPAEMGMFPIPAQGGGGTGGGGDGSGGGSGGSGGSGEGGSGGPAATGDGGGCACNAAGATAGGLGLGTSLALAGALAWSRRRRRRGSGSARKTANKSERNG
jgi:uncharacterized membrane protein YgcG